MVLIGHRDVTLFGVVRPILSNRLNPLVNGKLIQQIRQTSAPPARAR